MSNPGGKWMILIVVTAAAWPRNHLAHPRDERALEDLDLADTAGRSRRRGSSVFSSARSFRKTAEDLERDRDCRIERADDAPRRSPRAHRADPAPMSFSAWIDPLLASRAGWTKAEFDDLGDRLPEVAPPPCTRFVSAFCGWRERVGDEVGERRAELEQLLEDVLDRLERAADASR